MKKLENDWTEPIDELWIKLKDAESTIRQMIYNIEEKEKLMGPIIMENKELLGACKRVIFDDDKSDVSDVHISQETLKQVRISIINAERRLNA